MNLCIIPDCLSVTAETPLDGEHENSSCEILDCNAWTGSVLGPQAFYHTEKIHNSDVATQWFFFFFHCNVKAKTFVDLSRK